MKGLSLNQCEKNITYRVDEVVCLHVPVSRRLSELGFVKDAQLKVIQYSALKRTLLIEIEGYVISLRASVAVLVKVIR